jgi:hypothetical protein
VIVFVLLPEAERTEHKQHHYSHIECDVPGCGVRAPKPSEMQGGLMHMGWWIGPGQHRCPRHYHDEVPAHGPQYRDE